MRSQVEELKVRKTPSTSHEVLEERNKAVSKAEEMVRRRETMYNEAVEVVSMMWEVLLDDETMDKIKEDVQQADEKIIALKVDMKNMLIKERSAKVTELKKI